MIRSLIALSATDTHDRRPMNAEPPRTEASPQSGSTPTDWVEAVRRHVAAIRYGGIQITVHAGKVVQVERTERFRFEATTSETPMFPR